MNASRDGLQAKILLIRTLLYGIFALESRESSLEDAFRLNEENDRLRETRDELYEHLSILRLSLRIANRYHIPPRGEALNADVESYEPRPPYRAESPLDIATERQITNRALQHQVNALMTECEILKNSSLFGEYIYGEEMLSNR